MTSVPPPGGPPPSQPNSTDGPEAPHPMHGGGGGAHNMTEFMAMFSPEEKKKFMDILVKNIVSEIRKASKKYIEELKKQREEIQKG